MGIKRMIGIGDIYIAFVSWGNGGKRRPVLILAECAGQVTVFGITTQYESKSEAIRAQYFKIDEWQKAGLDRQSYVDTKSTITLPVTAIDSENPIGKLSSADAKRLIKFVGG